MIIKIRTYSRFLLPMYILAFSLKLFQAPILEALHVLSHHFHALKMDHQHHTFHKHNQAHDHLLLTLLDQQQEAPETPFPCPTIQLDKKELNTTSLFVLHSVEVQLVHKDYSYYGLALPAHKLPQFLPPQLVI